MKRHLSWKDIVVPSTEVEEVEFVETVEIEIQTEESVELESDDE